MRTSKTVVGARNDGHRRGMATRAGARAAAVALALVPLASVTTAYADNTAPVPVDSSTSSPAAADPGGSATPELAPAEAPAVPESQTPAPPVTTPAAAPASTPPTSPASTPASTTIPTPSPKPSPKPAAPTPKPTTPKPTTPTPKPTTPPKAPSGAGLVLTVKSSAFVDANGNRRIDAGETYRVVWTVTNRAETKASALALGSGTGTSTCAASTIAPGASVSCTTVRSVGQSDVDGGAIAVTAKATATIGAAQSSTAWLQAAKNIKAVPGLRVKQTYNLTQDADGNRRVSVGDTVGFVYDLSNSGNVTLTSPAITSRLLRDRGLTITCHSGSLKANTPGQSIRCWSPGFRVKSAQAVMGKVVNTAVVSARSKDGRTTAKAVSTLVISPIANRVRVTPSKPVKVDRPPKAPRVPAPKPGISLVSRITHVSDEYAMNGVTDVGDKVTFQFVVSNTGKLQLSHLSVTDSLLTKQSIRVVCPGTAVAPGQSMTCSGDKPYVVTRQDFASGKLMTVSVARATVDATGKTIGVRAKLSRPLAVKLDETLGSSALAMTGPSALPAITITGGILVLLGGGFVAVGTRRRQLQALHG